MTGDNIIPFPQTGVSDEFASRINEIACLVEDVSNILDTAGRQVDIRDLLRRLLQASRKLAELGNLILHSSDRVSVQKQLKLIEKMISETQQRLERLVKTTDALV